MRRTLTIVSTIIVLVGIGTGVYFYFFANTTGVTIAPPEGGGLPIAGQGTMPITGNTPDTEAPVGAPVSVSARLVKISPGPVALGAVVIDHKAVNASSSPEVAVSYIERQSGNVFSYKVGAATLTRTSNKTVPGIQTASWLPDGSLAFVRYLSGTDFSTINTYALPSNGSNGFFLPQNLADVAASPTRVLTLSSGVNGSTVSLRRIDGTSPSTVFTTHLSALRSSFSGKSQYLVFTKPSMTLAGNAFLIETSGRFSRIAGPHNGLVALASPLGKWILVSFVQEGSMRMNLINTATAESIPLPVATIADKCVWTADDSVIYCGIPVNPPSDFNYPDDWYQGAVPFNDRLWKIQVDGRYAQLVLDFSAETKDSLDAEALAINPANTVLVFVNKNDGSLWSYSL